MFCRRDTVRFVVALLLDLPLLALGTVLKLQCLEDISNISDTVKSIPGQLSEFSLAMGVRQWRESNVD